MVQPPNWKLLVQTPHAGRLEGQMIFDGGFVLSMCVIFLWLHHHSVSQMYLVGNLKSKLFQWVVKYGQNTPQHSLTFNICYVLAQMKRMVWIPVYFGHGSAWASKIVIVVNKIGANPTKIIFGDLPSSVVMMPSECPACDRPTLAHVVIPGYTPHYGGHLHQQFGLSSV